MIVNFPKTWFNDSFYPLLKNRSRVLALKGGSGSGKSHFIAQKWIFRALSESNLRVPIVRKTKNSIRDSVFKLLCDQIERSGFTEFFEIRQTDMRIYCPTTNSEFFSLGVDDEQKIKSLTEPNGMWIEEVTELTYDEWNQMKARMRGVLAEGVNYKQMIVSFNPIDTDHWVHNELFPPQVDQALEDKFQWRRNFRMENRGKWIEFSEANVVSSWESHHDVLGDKIALKYSTHHSNHEDNRFLEDEDRAVLVDYINKDKTFYEVYCLGKWGTVGNLVFEPMWKFREPPESFDEVFYGMDFGYHHPSVLVMVGKKDTEFYIKELLYVKKMNKPDLMEHIQKEDLIEFKDAEIYADSSEPDTIDMFVDAGFNMTESLRGNNSVKDGIDFLKSCNVFTHLNNTNLNRELRSYKWKLDNAGKPLEGIPVPVNDDCIAAVRYAIHTNSKNNEVKVGFVKAS